MPGRTDALIFLALIGALSCCACGGAPEGPPQDAGAKAAAPAAPASAGPVTPAAPPSAGQAMAGSGARITGHVLYTGAPRPAKPIQVTKDHAVCGAKSHVDESLLVGRDGGVRNAVVSVGPIAAGGPWPAAGKPTLDQRGCWFNPHVLLAPAGDPIDVINSDGILHNIHTYPQNNPPANLAQPKFRKVLNLAFAAPDTVQVKCDVHSWMNAWIVVTPHPYYAVTDASGAFSLAGVPPGTYTLTVWHETLGTRAQPVTAAPGGASEATITFQD
jgi:plastocyanin